MIIWKNKITEIISKIFSQKKRTQVTSSSIITIEEKRDAIRKILFAEDKVPNNKSYKLHDKEFLQDQFPELVLLNESLAGIPVFWFHSVGGVQPYSIIAKHTIRPFYGIETRGFRTTRKPLQGVSAMAAYYYI